jgi:hypothetical protein
MGHHTPVADGVLEAVLLGLVDSVADGDGLGVPEAVEDGEVDSVALGLGLGVLDAVEEGDGVALGVLETVALGVRLGVLETVALGVRLGVELTVELGVLLETVIALISVTRSSPHSASASQSLMRSRRPWLTTTSLFSRAATSSVANVSSAIPWRILASRPALTVWAVDASKIVSNSVSHVSPKASIRACRSFTLIVAMR